MTPLVGVVVFVVVEVPEVVFPEEVFPVLVVFVEVPPVVDVPPVVEVPPVVFVFVDVPPVVFVPVVPELPVPVEVPPPGLQAIKIQINLKNEDQYDITSFRKSSHCKDICSYSFFGCQRGRIDLSW